MTKINHKIFFVIIFLLINGHHFISGQSSTTSKPLKVGIVGSAPFIVDEANSTSGISYEIWESLANKEGWLFTTQKFSDVDTALQAVKNKQLDILIGPISITSERLEYVDFSQPYYYAGQSIMSRIDAPSLWDRIEPFFSKKLLDAILVFLAILALVGALFWLAERKSSPQQFSHKPLRGIGSGMWLAVVTMSTVGYGDKAPVTFWGRLIAGCWIIISIIFATSLVGGIASTLTLTGMGSNTITEVQQLNGKVVASPSLLVVKDFLYKAHAQSIDTETLDDACKLLREKKVDAIVFDRAQLLYYQSQHPTDNFIVGRSQYDPLGYGFAFPMHSPLKKVINIQLLHLAETGDTKRIIKRWINDENYH